MTYRNPVRAVGVVGTVATASAGGTTSPAVAQRGAMTTNNVGGTTSLPLTHPTGLAAGDFLIAVVASGLSGSWSSPSGWTTYDALYPANNGLAQVFGKVATAADVSAGSTTFTRSQQSNVVGVMMAVSGGLTGNLRESANQVALGSGGGTVSVPIRSALNDAVLTYAATMTLGTITGPTWSGPATAPAITSQQLSNSINLKVGLTFPSWATVTPYNFQYSFGANLDVSAMAFK